MKRLLEDGISDICAVFASNSASLGQQRGDDADAPRLSSYSKSRFRKTRHLERLSLTAKLTHSAKAVGPLPVESALFHGGAVVLLGATSRR